MNDELLIYSETGNNRTEYIFRYILTDRLGLRYSQTSILEEAVSSELPVLFYTSRELEGKLCIRPSGLLKETGIRGRKIDTGVWDGLPILFASDPGQPLPFDIFSASFWLMTRYEEYLDYTHDIHGRFPARESFAYRAGFLDLPVINLWAIKMGEILRNFYPGIKIKKPRFHWRTSLDIDHAWAFLNKSRPQTLRGLAGSILKGGKDFSKRIKVLRGKEPDPFFTFDFIKEIHSGFPEKLLVFFLSGKPSTHDRNIHPGNEEWKELVKDISARYTSGIHPSYRSNQNPDFLREEYETLSELIPYPVINSRQHFLKLKLPYTYRKLIELGIQNDFSMGYPGQPGYRAGTCTPFPFYDLPEEKITELTIYPITLMDRTLKDYLHKVPEEGIEIIETYIDIAEKACGWFIPIFHNDSLSDYGEWEGWRDVYVNMIEILKSKTS